MLQKSEICYHLYMPYRKMRIMKLFHSFRLEVSRYLPLGTGTNTVTVACFVTPWRVVRLLALRQLNLWFGCDAIDYVGELLTHSKQYEMIRSPLMCQVLEHINAWGFIYTRRGHVSSEIAVFNFNTYIVSTWGLALCRLTESMDTFPRLPLHGHI